MLLLTPAILKASALIVFPALTLASPVVEGARSTNSNLIKRNLDEHTSIGRIVPDTADCITFTAGPDCTPGICDPQPRQIVHTFRKDDSVPFGCWLEGTDPESFDWNLYYNNLQYGCWVAGDQVVTEVKAAHSDIRRCVEASGH